VSGDTAWAAPSFGQWHAITGLLSAYARAADARDADAQVGLFTEDGLLLVYRPRASEPSECHRGHEALRAAFDVLTQFTATTHVLGQIDVEVCGQRARVLATGMSHHITDRDGTRQRFTMADRYEDELLHDGERWRFAQRVKRTDWTETVVSARTPRAPECAPGSGPGAARRLEG